MKKKNPTWRYPTHAEMLVRGDVEPTLISRKRGRGRPKGSRNKVAAVAAPVSRGRGRPLGSKNKKRGPGRPKGSKNKKPRATYIAKKRGPGRPLGSKNKRRGRGRPKGATTSLPTASRESKMTRFGTRRVFRNMTHFPKSPRGRPEKKFYWILDLYDSKESHLATKISKWPTSKKAAEMEAIDFLGHHANGAVVRSLTIAGPYKFKPNASTERI